MDAAEWLRREIERDRAEAMTLAALPDIAMEWREQASGCLDIGTPQADHWDCVWPQGDSRVTRFIAGNDPRWKLADCGAKLALIGEHGGEHMCFSNSRDGNTWDWWIGDCRVMVMLASAYRFRAGYAEHWGAVLASESGPGL